MLYDGWMSDIGEPIPSIVETNITLTPLVSPKKPLPMGIIVAVILGLIGVIALIGGVYAYTQRAATPPVLSTPTPTPVKVATPLPKNSEDLLAPPKKATASTTPKTSPTEKPITTIQTSSLPQSTIAPTTKIVTKASGQVGTVTDTGYANTMGSIDVGSASGYIYRGFVGFDLADIPASATISKATLRLYQRVIYGSPYSTLGTLQVDHLDYGTTLDAGSYTGGTVYAVSFATFGSPQLAEWKTLDVTTQVKKDRLSHASTQFRLHFGTETKGGSTQKDLVSFSSTTSGSEQPQLVIEYK